MLCFLFLPDGICSYYKALNELIYTVGCHTLILVQMSIVPKKKKKNEINVFIYVILEKVCCSLNQCFAFVQIIVRCVVCVCRKSIQAQLRRGRTGRKPQTAIVVLTEPVISLNTAKSLTFGSLIFKKASKDTQQAVGGAIQLKTTLTRLKPQTSMRWWCHMVIQRVTQQHSHPPQIKTILISKHLFL